MSNTIDPTVLQNATSFTTGQVDTDQDGVADTGKVEVTTKSGLKSTGVYNLHTPEGRAAFKQACLDLGLAMPGFVTAADGEAVNNLSPGAQKQLAQLGTSAASTVASSLANDTVKTAASADLQAQWHNFISQQNIGSAMDVNALVQFVLREAYMENTKDLQFYAQKVRYFNKIKGQIREELYNARRVLGENAATKDEAALTGGYKNTMGGNEELDFYTVPQLDGDNDVVVRDPTPATGDDGKTSPITTKEELSGYVDSLEEKLSGVGDDAQLANVDLQNMLQKQQQTLQMMSNISKMLHDTAMAIIRKIGG